MSRNTWKKTLFSHFFCGTSCKKLKINAVFFCIFCELCTKCLEKREKNCFLERFVEHREKVQKCSLFTFYAIFVQIVSKNVKKHCFLNLLWNVTKKLKKHCFFRIFSKFYHKASRKTWKTLFSKTFSGRSRKKFKKTLFFAFLANFLRMSRKMWKTVSPHFLRNVAKKAQ